MKTKELNLRGHAFVSRVIRLPLFVTAIFLFPILAHAQLEQLIFPLDVEVWELSSYTEDAQNGISIQTFKRKDESIEEWSELVEVFNAGKRPFDPSPLDLMYKLKAMRQKRCASVSWNIIEQRPDGVIFEANATGCYQRADELELGRIIKSRDNTWHVMYVTKVKDLPRDVRDAWVRWLYDIRVELFW